MRCREETMEKLVIDRKIWLRGEQGRSYLRRSYDGRMCCLGIYCASRGIDQKLLNGLCMPSSIDPRDRRDLPDWLFCSSLSRNDAYDLAIINDRPPQDISEQA